MEFFNWKEQRDLLFTDAVGYLQTLEKHLVKPSRFDNMLLFNISIMSYEKMMASVLAHYKTEPTHHTPLAMFREASDFDKNLNEDMKETARFIQSFESICSFDDKGYKTPTNEELLKIITGLIDIKHHVISLYETTPL